MATITYAYQWFRIKTGTSPVLIPGATQSNYTVALADENFQLYCQVTATDIAGNTVVITAPTPIVTQSNAGVISLIQSPIAQTATSSTIPITLTNVIEGDLLTLSGCELDNIAVSSVSGGGTWVKAQGVNLNVGGQGTVEQWYCLSTIGGSSVTINVNLAAAPATNRGTFMVSEWTGPSVWAFDKSVASINAAVSINPISPALTPSKAGELIVVGGTFQGKVTAVSTGWNQINTTYTVTDLTENADAAYIVYAGTTAISCTWTQLASDRYTSSAMAFVPTFSTTIPSNIIPPAITDNTSGNSTISVGDSVVVTTGAWD